MGHCIPALLKYTSLENQEEHEINETRQFMIYPEHNIL
jgi:hypothetical protein